MATTKPMTINSTTAIMTPMIVLRSTDPALFCAIVEVTSSLIIVVSIPAEVDSSDESVVAACVVGWSFCIVVVAVLPSDVVVIGCSVVGSTVIVPTV